MSCNTKRYLTNDGFFSTTNGHQPLLPQNSWSFRNTVKMTRVFCSLVSRTKLTVRKTACCRHDVHSGLPAVIKNKTKKKLSCNVSITDSLYQNQLINSLKWQLKIGQSIRINNEISDVRVLISHCAYVFIFMCLSITNRINRWVSVTFCTCLSYQVPKSLSMQLTLWST